MKAIKVTQTLKDQNKFLENRTVGDWYIGNIPDVFITAEGQIHGFKSRADLHSALGWKDVIQPTIGENQKRTNEIIESETSITYAVVDLTDAELEALIPNQISKLNFKIGLLTNHGITNAQVQAFFDTIPNEMTRESLHLLWFESSFFERDDENLINFAPALGLTDQDLKNIFIQFEGY